jgi:hypothetical protein
MQLLALVADQMSRAVPPLLTLPGLAVRKMLGAPEPPPAGGGRCPAMLLAKGPELVSVTLPSQPYSSTLSAQHSATVELLRETPIRAAARRIELNPSSRYSASLASRTCGLRSGKAFCGFCRRHRALSSVSLRAGARAGKQTQQQSNTSSATAMISSLQQHRNWSRHSDKKKSLMTSIAAQ